MSEKDDIVDDDVVEDTLDVVGPGAFLTPWITSKTDIVGNHICPLTVMSNVISNHSVLHQLG